MKVSVVFDMPVSEEELWQYIATVRVKQFAFDVDGSVFAYATPREYTNCQLKSLPKKMNETEYMQKVSSDGDWYEQVIGWNKCIDEIIGETE